MSIFSLGLLAYSNASGCGNLLNSVGAQQQYLGVQLVALAVDVGLIAGTLWIGLGLVGVATATLTSSW